MTILNRLIYKALLFFVLSTFLTVGVFAQEADNASTATTSESEENIEENWFEVEKLSGNKIQVGDFVVGPGRAEISVKPGETVVQYVTLANRIESGTEFRIEVEDIKGSTDGSSAVSLMGEERGPYSIFDYISIPEYSLTLDLGELAKIPVTISVPEDAEPGGYYGSVLISTTRVGSDRDEPIPSSPIIARVGSLIFLTVEGEVEKAGKTLSIDLLNDKLWYESGPIELGILYENTGSVHVNPYGELSISNMFGEEVGFVELEPWFVLPNSLRFRELSWDREFLLGKYTVKAKINRGYDDVIDEVSVSFWVLPWKFVGGTFLTLFIVFFLIRAFFKHFEFRRKT